MYFRHIRFTQKEKSNNDRANFEQRHYGCGPSGVGEDGRIRHPRKKTQCERGDNAPKIMKKNIFPVADGTVKFSGGDQDGINQFEEKTIKIFWENQKGLHHIFKTHCRMPVKHKMISGPFLETSSTDITLNRESIATRQENNNFLFHCYKLTSPGLLIQPWMWCRKAALMIIGILIDQEICLILGQVSHNSLY